MRSPSARATSTVEWAIQPVSVGGLTFAVARLEVSLYLADASTGRPSLMQSAWLDTGAPVSVIPFHVQQKVCGGDPSPGCGPVGPANDATWAISTSGSPPISRPICAGPLSLLAKFPQSDPPGDDVSVLLGLDFFLTRQAEFQLLLPPQDGRILLP